MDSRILPAAKTPLTITALANRASMRKFFPFRICGYIGQHYLTRPFSLVVNCTQLREESEVDHVDRYWIEQHKTSPNVASSYDALVSIWYLIWYFPREHLDVLVLVLRKEVAIEPSAPSVMKCSKPQHYCLNN